MTRRTTILRLLLALLLGAICCLGATPAAYAGGPTSVLMTNPSLGRAAALYFENQDYRRLYTAVGEEVTGAEQPPSTVNGNFGQDEVRLTWLIHDMQIWRIDRVHLTGGDGVWLETVTDLTGTGDVFDRPARWHRPKDGQALTTLLSNAGLFGPDPAPSAAAKPADSSSPATTPASAARQSVAPMLGAAIGGLLIGAACMLLLRRRTPADGPRFTLTG